tara:strand:+ start:109 stop:738 length:630 start_codon:yes stop_codon:yes gene_type:complete
MSENILKEYSEHLTPLNKAIKDYNEFWYVGYFNYNPEDFVISSYGGGCEFNNWEEGQAEKQDGYIPMLHITTEETHGYTIIELNNSNAQKLYEEHRNVYEWLEYLVGRLDQKRFSGFGYGDDREYCHGIGSETTAGVYAPNEWNQTKDDVSTNSLILCFSTGGGEAYDQQLDEVIRVKKDGEWYKGWGLVWDYISENCSPRISNGYGGE